MILKKITVITLSATLAAGPTYALGQQRGSNSVEPAPVGGEQNRGADQVSATTEFIGMVDVAVESSPEIADDLAKIQEAFFKLSLSDKARVHDMLVRKLATAKEQLDYQKGAQDFHSTNHPYMKASYQIPMSIAYIAGAIAIITGTLAAIGKYGDHLRRTEVKVKGKELKPNRFQQYAVGLNFKDYRHLSLFLATITAVTAAFGELAIDRFASDGYLNMTGPELMDLRATIVRLENYHSRMKQVNEALDKADQARKQ